MAAFSTKQKQLSNIELSHFSGQMAMLLRSGMPAQESLYILKDDDETDGGQMKNIARASASVSVPDVLLSIMQDGTDFPQALMNSGLFPPYYCAAARVGFESGNLDMIMKNLEAYYIKEENTKKYLRSFLFYPFLLSSLVFFVIVIFLMQGMPIYKSIYEDLGAALTGFPLFLFHLSEGLQKYFLVFSLIFMALLFFFIFVNFTDRGARLFYPVGNHFRFIREQREIQSVSRFSSAMSTLLKSGMYPERAVALCTELNTEPLLHEKLTLLDERLAAGENFAVLLKELGIFKGPYAKLADIGIKSGDMDSTFSKISDYYEEEMERRREALVSVMEPVMVVILAVLTGGVLLSVMLPLLSIVSSL